MLLSDCTPRDPAALVLLNGPCIGHTAEGAMDAMDFMGCEYHEIWVNYNDLTATSLESWLVREIIPKWP